MIKAIAIDDEEHCLETLALLLNEYCPDVELLDQCSSARQGLDSIHQHKPDLVFLDIEMPLMNGFDLLEQLPSISFAVIFTTSYDRYAIKAIRFSALDYLLKPIDPKELVMAINKIQQQPRLPLNEQFEMLLRQIQGKTNGFHKIAVPTADGFELIPTEHIVYCEACNNYTYFFLRNKIKQTIERTLRYILI